MNSVLCVWLLSAIACGYAIAITDYCDVDCRNDVHIACNNSGVSLVYLIEVWAIQLFIDHIKHLVDVAWPILCVCVLESTVRFTQIEVNAYWLINHSIRFSFAKAFDCSCPIDAEMVTFNQTQNERIVELHNICRNKVAAGTVNHLKAAKRMATMVEWTHRTLHFTSIVVLQTKEIDLIAWFRCHFPAYRSMIES